MTHPIFDQFFVLEVPCTEWGFVILNFSDNTEGVQVNDLNIVQDGRYTLYYLRRSAFDQKALARALGMRPAELDQRGVIHLPLLDDDSKYPKPTVPYTGRA